MSVRQTFAFSFLYSNLMVAAAMAQTGGPYSLTWSTIDGGGQMLSSGGAFEIGGTIGQPDAQVAPVMAGGAFEISGGFWPVANVCYCLGDLNGDGMKNGQDIQRFVGCVLSSGNCSCADVDQAGGITLADVSVFVSDLLNGPACP